MDIKLISAGLFWRLRGIVVIGIAQALVAVIFALSVKTILDVAAQSRPVGAVSWPIFMALGTAVMASLLKWQDRVLCEKAGQDFTHHIRMALFDHLSRMPYQLFHEQRKGPLLLRFMNDLTALRQWITLGLSRLIIGGLMVTIGLGCIWVINPWLGLIVSFIFFASAGLMLMQGAGLNQSVRQARKRRSVLASRVTEKLMMVDVVQKMTARQLERRNIQKASRQLVGAMCTRADRVGRLRAMTLLSTNFCIAIMAALPLLSNGRGALTTGEVLACLALISFMAPALFDLGRVFEYFQGAKIAAEKIEKVFAKGPLILAPEKGHRKRISSQRLRIKDLHWNSHLRGVNLDLRPGKKIVITGRNGSGKSTLLRLIMRLDLPDSGEITLGRASISSVGLGSLRRMITMICNEDQLIKGTVLDNLQYPARAALTTQDRDLLAPLKLRLDDKDSPFYLERPIFENGRNLSQGQKALLLIARALLRRPKILLIDEIDLHLDRKNRRRFLRLMARFSGSLIFVSHHLEGTEIFDKIYSIRGGRLRAQPLPSAPVLTFPDNKLTIVEASQ